MKTNRPVKYGQCWVFSGLLTTLMRSIGIPTRSVTNFQSAHDTENNMIIDKYIRPVWKNIYNFKKNVLWLEFWNCLKKQENRNKWDKWTSKRDIERYGLEFPCLKWNMRQRNRSLAGWILRIRIKTINLFSIGLWFPHILLPSRTGK